VLLYSSRSPPAVRRSASARLKGVVVTNEQWSRAKSVLTLALSTDPAARDRLLQNDLQTPPELKAEVTRVLREIEVATRRHGLSLADCTTRSVALGRDGGWLSRAFAPPGAADSPFLSPGDRCGHYQIVRLLGAGGMGQVYLAEDPELGTPAALKLVTDELLPSADARTRLHREAARAAQLRYHPHIATVLQFADVEVKGRTVAVLAMEYVAGTPASQLLQAGPVQAVQAIRWAVQVTRAIEFAHDKGILHCDLKPANLHVDQTGTGDHVKVLDFGIARAMFEGRAAAGGFGTPPYMAPEQLISGECSTATDIYALGVTLFELVTGRRPYPAADALELLMHVIGAPVPKASAFVSGLPAGLDAVLQRAMAKRPDERFQSMAEFRRELEALIEVRPASPARLRTVAAVVASVAFIILTGFITSLALDQGLGRVTQFRVSSLQEWFFWGIRSLVAPVVFSLTLLLAALCVSSAVRLMWPTLARRSSTVRALSERAVTRATALADGSTAIAGQILLLVHVAILVGLGFSFRSLLLGFMNFMTDARGSIDALRPSNLAVHELYGYLVTTELLLFLVSWFVLLRVRRRRGEHEGSVYLAAGLAAAALSLFLFSARFRILSHNEHVRVEYSGQACYLVEDRGPTALLFCPLAYPRNVVADASAFVRTGSIESIFTPLDRPPTH
jgi:hypothetical protein